MRKLISLLLSCFIVLGMIIVIQSDISAYDEEYEYWKSYSNDYYYNEMNELEKDIYRRVEVECERIFTSSEDIQFFRMDLDDLDLTYDSESVDLVIEIFGIATSANPQYFFHGQGGFFFGYAEDGKTIADMSLELMPDFQNGAARQKAKEEIRCVIESYVKDIPSNAFPEEKEKIIHDLMCEKVKYGETMLPSGIETDQSLYTAIKGNTVCMGYSLLFEALMNRVGVRCVVIIGVGHAWNAIYLHDNWYYVDVTNNDCFDPIGYPTYNFSAERYTPIDKYSVYAPKSIYDNLDDDPNCDYSFTNYTSRYINKGENIFFIVNDLDNEYGRICKLLNSDTANIEWVAYDGKTYKVSNCENSGKKEFSEFVERLYVIALCRDSEKEGKDFWCFHVGNGDLTGADCAREFLNSQEFTDKEISNDAFVKILYRVFFNRESIEDPDGYNFWLKSLETVDRKAVIEGFINSEEWFNVCSSYGVKSGSKIKKTTASDSVISFATRLYTECLGRDPEQEGLDFWSLGLTNLELTGSQAAREFFYSKEFIGYGFDDEEYVTRLYKTFMGRDPEEEGFNFWVKELSNGLNRDEVFDYFCVCPEFTQICESYSIKR